MTLSGLKNSLSTLFDPIKGLGQLISYDGNDSYAIVKGYGGQIVQDAGVAIADALILVQRSDVPDPERGDPVVIDGVSYAVLDVLDADGLGASFELALQKA